uniref:Phospholipase A2-like central domain-containing protein n=1 Tax=Gouania willdenowi TaxID=441366 RepID=A0A8C5HX60_GOUWI
TKHWSYLLRVSYSPALSPKCFNIFSICLLGLKVHDQCYSDAIQNPDCWPFVDNPYLYSYDQKNRKVTCGSANDKCGMLICECDRKAAECFSPPSDQCK